MAKPRDRWADWLVSGRQRGMDERRQRQLQRRLARLRDRVLRGARPRKGERILDVGAGTGLIAHGARSKVGAHGLVVALDISHDALAECEREAAAEQEQAVAPLRAVRADAARLPVADESIDVVFTRSVLMYLPDHAAGVRELYRVLKPGGRASIFEPINSVYRGDRWGGDRDMSSLEPEAGQIAHYLEEQPGRAERAAMTDFDERDLMRWFVEAGFVHVQLTYEFSYVRGTPGAAAEQILAGLRQRLNPVQPSYEEAARAVLGAAADAYLARYIEVLRAQPGRRLDAGAYVTARKRHPDGRSRGRTRRPV
jgi:ubiquinone/menaquinone biosynthesis C-methylase UbiE